MSEPSTTPVTARDVVPHEWALWCSVDGSLPFANEIVAVRWSEDGQYLSFMLESHNFMRAAPGESLDLIPFVSQYRTEEMRERSRAEHAKIIANPPVVACCVTCRRALADSEKEEET